MIYIAANNYTPNLQYINILILLLHILNISWIFIRVKTTGVVEYSFMMKNGKDHKEIIMVSNLTLKLIFNNNFKNYRLKTL